MRTLEEIRNELNAKTKEKQKNIQEITKVVEDWKEKNIDAINEIAEAEKEDDAEAYTKASDKKRLAEDLLGFNSKKKERIINKQEFSKIDADNLADGVLSIADKCKVDSYRSIAEHIKQIEVIALEAFAQKEITDEILLSIEYLSNGQYQATEYSREDSAMGFYKQIEQTPMFEIVMKFSEK